MQVFASRLDLEAVSLAFGDFAHARLGAHQAEQVRTGAHRGAGGLDQVAGLAAHRVKGFLAERDRIDQLLLVGRAAGSRGHGERREIRRLVAQVAQLEGSLAYVDHDGAAKILRVPARTLAGLFVDHVAAYVAADAHFEHQRMGELAESRVEARRTEPDRDALPVARAVELDAVASLDIEVGLRALGRAEFQRSHAVGERAARVQRIVARGVAGQRDDTIRQRPGRAAAELRPGTRASLGMDAGKLASAAMVRTARARRGNFDMEPPSCGYTNRKIPSRNRFPPIET